MSDELTAVWEDDKILAVFSNEGLAQTHAAKLRCLPQPADPADRHTYRVSPLPVNVAVLDEPYYSAYLNRNMGVFDYLDSEVEIEAEHELTDELPETSVQDFESHSAGHPDWVEYVAYGWTPAEARAKLDALMATYQVSPQDGRQA